MKSNTTVTVHACDRAGCDKQWLTSKDGKVRYNTGTTWNHRVVPTTCDVLAAEFCSPECHQKAHFSEAHGSQTWRRRSLKPRVSVV